VEFIQATWTDVSCKWTFTDFAEREAAQRIVMTLEPLFIVREVRFLDQPVGGTPKYITSARPDQMLRVEVVFDLPPPASVYVDLGSPKDELRVIVMAGERPDVFRSEAFSFNGLKGD
jgi:hypothetical protein